MTDRALARSSSGGCRGERAAAIAATPRSARLRDDSRAAPSHLSTRVALVRSDRPGRYLPPRSVSTTHSHSWWTDKRGPVTVILGVLCAVGFGLIVFVVVNLAIGLVIGLGLLVRSVERAGSGYAHHARIP
jgi:hypothetical protein